MQHYVTYVSKVTEHGCHLAEGNMVTSLALDINEPVLVSIDEDGVTVIQKYSADIASDYQRPYWAEWLASIHS